MVSVEQFQPSYFLLFCTNDALDDLLIHTNILKYTLQKYKFIFKYTLSSIVFFRPFGLINSYIVAVRKVALPKI